MDKDGNWIWVRNVGSNKTDRANGIAIDVCNDIYINGEYRNSMVFTGANASNGTDTLSHKQKRDVFVAKINANGDWQWAKRARSSGTDKSYQMSVDKNKQVFVCGTSRGEMTFSNGLVVNAQIPGDTTASAWVAQLDGSTNTGDWLWAKMAGCDTDDDDRTNDICVDGFGNVYAVGFFEELANFDGIILDATGRKKDIFVWKMSMTPGSFTLNNIYDTIFTDSMVFNPIDTGIFTTRSYSVNGCDSVFTDSILYKRLGVKINFDINDASTSTTINVNGININSFSQTINFYFGDMVSLSPSIDPLYGFSFWSSNNIILMPSTTNPTDSFYATNNDTIILHVYKLPTIVYDIFPSGTATSIDINNITINTFPFSDNYVLNDTVLLSPNIDPLYRFDYWSSDSVLLMPNATNPIDSFYVTNNDTIILHLYLIPPTAAYIYGSDTICSNENKQAQITIDFIGKPFFTFVYAIDGINQPKITTNTNPYIISTTTEGIYSLTNMSDTVSVGSTSGSAVVVVNNPPTAFFDIIPDTVTINYPTAHFVDKTNGNIVSWMWDFGDGIFSVDSLIANLYHTYPDSVGIYQITMIVTDENGCSGTTFNQLLVKDEYWLHIPNSFSPDLDGINDKFCLTYNGVRIETFQINIYDRNSGLVFLSNNINDMLCELEAKGWDGRHKDSGNELPMGTYIYEMYFQDFQGWKHQEQGYIYLLR
jgi:gliding motility-associated-like protein